MLDQIEVKQKTGNEPLIFQEKEIGIKLEDFWKWSVSDILSNVTRGRFAEFIVATALNVDPKTVRDEWGAYDLTSPEGIKIEVKSASYLQSWKQNKLSEISFYVKKTLKPDEAAKYSGFPSLWADVYVFCLLKHEDKKTVDPLNLDQWEFFVLSKHEIENCKYNSITLKSLKTLAEGVPYGSLREKIINHDK